MIHSEMMLMIDRCENWRRFFRQVQRIHAVPWYSPPTLGDVHEQEIIVKISPDMKDALLLEQTWRNLDHPAKKTFIKLEFISRLPHPVIWRKLKKHGDRIKNSTEHQLYTRSALEYFAHNLER